MEHYLKESANLEKSVIIGVSRTRTSLCMMIFGLKIIGCMSKVRNVSPIAMNRLVFMAIKVVLHV